jgi:hypothetical protein
MGNFDIDLTYPGTGFNIEFDTVSPPSSQWIQCIAIF